MLLPLALATGPRCNVVLSGDHKQLGPVVRSPFCREHGLARSLLERLMALPVYALGGAPGGSSDGGGGARACCVTKLLNNYRSHGAPHERPTISAGSRARPPPGPTLIPP
jgi:hypothetical protein